MTTIIAIAVGYIFYDYSVWWAFILTTIFGLIQAYTKSVMNFQFRSASASGLPSQAAMDAISNRVAHINMISSFVIWGFGIYAAVIMFL